MATERLFMVMGLGRRESIVLAEVPLGTCGKCRRVPSDGELRIHCDLWGPDGMSRATICRSCMGEHMPLTLAHVEENDPDVDGERRIL